MDRVSWVWSESLQRYVLEVLLQPEAALIHLHQEEQPVGWRETQRVIDQLREGWKQKEPPEP